MTLGELFRARREERKLSQERVAADLNISIGTVANIEAGRTEPGNALKLVASLGITPEEIGKCLKIQEYPHAVIQEDTPGDAPPSE